MFLNMWLTTETIHKCEYSGNVNLNALHKDMFFLISTLGSWITIFEGLEIQDAIDTSKQFIW